MRVSFSWVSGFVAWRQCFAPPVFATAALTASSGVDLAAGQKPRAGRPNPSSHRDVFGEKSLCPVVSLTSAGGNSSSSRRFPLTPRIPSGRHRMQCAVADRCHCEAARVAGRRSNPAESRRPPTCTTSPVTAARASELSHVLFSFVLFDEDRGACLIESHFKRSLVLRIVSILPAKAPLLGFGFCPA